MQRLRITFAKTAAMQYTGHLDLHKTWERTLRRARLPLAYSEGFNPHPKIQLGAALPLGFTSDCELVDVWFETPQELEEARAALEIAAPPGLRLNELREVPERDPALQTQIVAAEYRVTLPLGVEAAALDERVSALLAAPEIRRTRREKSLQRLIEDRLYQKVSYSEYRDKVRNVYDGPKGAILATCSMLSLHIPLGDRLLRAWGCNDSSRRGPRYHLWLGQRQWNSGHHNEPAFRSLPAGQGNV